MSNPLAYYEDCITKRLSEEMTFLQAETIRAWRVDHACSYEQIGAMWCARYRGWEAVSTLGEALCYRAARILHEYPDDTPWKDINI